MAQMSAASEPALPHGLVDRETLIRRFQFVRAATESLTANLAPEDQMVQSMEDASPSKWHLAHTSWFFEAFILAEFAAGYRSFHPDFAFLFNSYYETAGPRHARPRRGMITRPAVDEVMAYRGHVTAAMAALMGNAEAAQWPAIASLAELGLNHEQQHQELLLTDILHAFSCNPICPAFTPYRPASAGASKPLSWLAFAGGIREIGHDGAGFAFDSEGPRHEVLLRPYRLATRLVTNAEWIAFIDDGGYRVPQLWLSDGWATVQREGWGAPGYWRRRDGAWHAMTLAGLQPVEADAPVCHVSFYEAEAFARWAGCRLPTEAEWEVSAAERPVVGNFVSYVGGGGMLRPLPDPGGTGLRQMYGDVWQWTQTPYGPYPGFQPPEGAVGEYNGKFMCNQVVLRGGSCATPEGHTRATYRNFFYPHQRWQFMGLRLAEDA